LIRTRGTRVNNLTLLIVANSPLKFKGRRCRSSTLTSDSGNGWSRGGPEVEWWIGVGGFSNWGRKERREGPSDFYQVHGEMGNREGKWEMHF